MKRLITKAKNLTSEKKRLKAKKFDNSKDNNKTGKKEKN